MWEITYKLAKNTLKFPEQSAESYLLGQCHTEKRFILKISNGSRAKVPVNLSFVPLLDTNRRLEWFIARISLSDGSFLFCLDEFIMFI